MARTAILALLLLFAIPAASAQAGPLYSIRLNATPTALGPGDAQNVTLTFERACPNSAYYYEATSATVDLRTSIPDASFSGENQVVFPSQVCAQQATVQVDYQARLLLASSFGGNVSTLQAAVALHPGQSGPLGMSGNSAESTFAVPLSSGAMVATSGSGGNQLAAKASPMPAGALVGLLLLASAAVALRRRDA